MIGALWHNDGYDKMRPPESRHDLVWFFSKLRATFPINPQRGASVRHMHPHSVQSARQPGSSLVGK
eukprot:scaffold141084_cov25-Prasinocladus_malaysianus.AAC.1